MSATGFPFMLELSLLFAMTSAKSSSFSPNDPSPGTPQSFTSFTIHATPSSTVASGFPVTTRATSSYLFRYFAAISGSSFATRPFSASTFVTQQWGKSAAQMAPCGAWSRPPSVPENPCTAPSLAFARLKPP